MEHMKKKWRVRMAEAPIIETDEEHLHPWTICKMYQNLHDDEYGKLTAQAICDQHNAQLETKS